MGFIDLITGRDTADRLLEASRAYSTTMRTAISSLAREDMGWSRIGVDTTADVVPLEVVKEHSVRARRLAAYNPLVQRGVGVRNAYMWSEPINAGDSELAEEITTVKARVRDESALCTDGMVAYVCNMLEKTANPVPLTRIVGAARQEGAADEGDIYAFLVEPVPTGDLENPVKEDPVWIPVHGHRWTRVEDTNGYETDPIRRIVYLAVNRQTGEQWGKPDLMGAVYWAQAYKEFLEAAHTMMKALARIAFKTTSANAGQQKAVLSQMAGASGVGGTASLGMGQDIQAVSKAGAGVDFAAGTPMAAMVSAALDVPLSVLLTDGSAGGRQGAETALEDPTFKAFELRRQLHADLIERVLEACGETADVVVHPLHTELIQRWGQVVTLAIQNGLLHREEGRDLMLGRLKPLNAKPVDDLPEIETQSQSIDDEPGKANHDDQTGVGPLSDGTNANRDEDGGETAA